MSNLIKESPQAMESVMAVATKAGLDIESLTVDQLINETRKISAPCNHNWDRAYKGHGTRVCRNCGGLQHN